MYILTNKNNENTGLTCLQVLQTGLKFREMVNRFSPMFSNEPNVSSLCTFFHPFVSRQKKI